MPAKTRKRRKKARVGAKKTRVFGGKRYTHNSCSRTKTDAKKRAKRLRDKGKKARVVKIGSKHCVYTRG